MKLFRFSWTGRGRIQGGSRCIGVYRGVERCRVGVEGRRAQVLKVELGQYLFSQRLPGLGQGVAAQPSARVGSAVSATEPYTLNPKPETGSFLPGWPAYSPRDARVRRHLSCSAKMASVLKVGLVRV